MKKITFLQGNLTRKPRYTYSQEFTDESSATAVKEYFENLKKENKYAFEINFKRNKPLNEETKKKQKMNLTTIFF